MINILTIAGSDPMGGAGIQGDLKTIAAHGCYGLSAITVITAQNSKSVTAIHEVPAKILKDQLEAIGADVPLSAIKIGMLYNQANIEVVAAFIDAYKDIPIILDPMIQSSTGRPLLKEDTIDYMKQTLFEKVTLITPNLHEASVLAKAEIRTLKDVVCIGKKMVKDGMPAMLIKGGHLTEDKTDTLIIADHIHYFRGCSYESIHNHGTGCGMSSSIACILACQKNEKNLVKAIEAAKEYVAKGIINGLDIGNGCGPMNHFTKGCDCIG